MRRDSGFTLIELMIVVAIIGILSAIAIPSYTRYVQRGDLVEGTQALAQYRVQMEQYYQDNRNYGVVPACGIAAPVLVNFTLACVSAGAGQSYVATATANAGTPVAPAAYTINQANAQATTAVPRGWGNAVPAVGWIVR